jgi:hypothetical protein
MTTEGSVFTCRQGVHFRLPLTLLNAGHKTAHMASRA